MSAQPSLHNIVAAYNLGKNDEARALCEQFLVRSAKNRDGWMWLGSIAMKDRRWRDAISAFDRALQIGPDPWTLGNLGACYVKEGCLEDAHYCFSSAIEIKPDLIDARVGLAAVLHGMRRFDDALEQLALADTIGPDDHQIDVRRGCTLVELGRYDEAQEAFERSVVKAAKFTYARLAAFDRETFESITSRPLSIAQPHLALQADRQTGALHGVVLISCDPSYARKYGFPFLRSYGAHAGTGHLLHVHLVDPDDTIVEEVSRVAQNAGLGRFAVSTETSPFPQREAQQRKAYYACARLLHLPYWLDQYQVPMVVLDTDFIVESPLDALFKAGTQKDVCLNIRHPIDSPWLDVIANVIVACPTTAAQRYFSAVASYAIAYLEREPEAWLVDQSALFCVLRMFERFASAPSVCWLPQAHQSGLWHIGHAYDHLLNASRFKRYAGNV